MRKASIISISIAGVLAAALGGLAPAAVAGEVVNAIPAGYYFFCRSNGAVGTNFYFSTTQRTAATVARGDLEKSFHDFLGKTYKYPATGSVSCVFAVGDDLQARTESTRTGTIANLHAANFAVVEAAWTYGK